MLGATSRKPTAVMFDAGWSYANEVIRHWTPNPTTSLRLLGIAFATVNT